MEIKDYMINKYINIFILAFFSIILASSSALGEQISKRCPFSCLTENIPRQYCSDWKRGDTCFINLKGSIVKTRCPFTCKTEGINKKFCRDWRRGNTCFVHDLRVNTPYRSNIHLGDYEEGFSNRPPREQYGRPYDRPYNRPYNRPHGYYDDNYNRDNYRRPYERPHYRAPYKHPVKPPRDLYREPFRRPKEPAPSRPLPPERKERRNITKRPCPYSCRTEGIPKSKCRDWKEDGLCVIERL